MAARPPLMGLTTRVLVMIAGLLALTVAASMESGTPLVLADQNEGPSVTRQASLSLGAKHSCVLTSAGGIKCWGDNRYGQLGDGTTTDSPTAVDVTGLTSGVAAISAGAYHTCALTTSGGVKCWGYGAYGRLGDGDGSYTSRLSPTDVVGLTSGVAAISAGNFHSCAVTTSGAAKCWGYNAYQSIGDGTTIDRHTPTNVSGLYSGVAAISAGTYHTCALMTWGGVKCWGGNSYQQIGDGTDTDRSTPVDVSGLTTGVAAISANMYTTCAVTTSGGAKCWGEGRLGALGTGGTDNHATPVDVAGLTSGVAAISASGYHSCALTTAGGALCWGHGGGRIGNGTRDGSLTPVEVVGLESGVEALTTGTDDHACAITSDNAVKCWGYNDKGQIGDGYVGYAYTRFSPTDVVSFSGTPTTTSTTTSTTTTTTVPPTTTTTTTTTVPPTTTTTSTTTTTTVPPTTTTTSTTTTTTTPPTTTTTTTVPPTTTTTSTTTTTTTSTTAPPTTTTTTTTVAPSTTAAPTTTTAPPTTTTTSTTTTTVAPSTTAASTTTTAPPTTTTTSTTAPPTATTTTTTAALTTTTTTAPSTAMATTTTTAPPAATTTAVPTGQIDVAAPSPATTTTAAVGTTSTPSTTSTPPTSTTSIASTTSTTAPRAATSTTSTTTTVPVPMPTPGDASVETQGVATIDGVVITPTITRSANRVVISAGPLDATIRATDSDGNTIPLGPDGRLRTPPGTNVEITTSGFTIGEPVEIWLFSTPTRLDGLTTNVDGTATGMITIPENAEVGDHRLVIDGTVRSTNQATITIGIAVPGETSPWRSVPIWIPVTVAIALALAVPTRWQRQRRRGHS